MDFRDEFDRASPPPLHFRVGLLLAAWSAPALLSCLQQWGSSALSGHPLSFWHIAAIEWPGWYLWAALTPFIFFVADRFPLARPVAVRTILPHVAAWSVCAIAHAVVTSAVRRLSDDAPSTIPFAQYVALSAISWLPSTTLLYAATAGAAHLMRSLQREQSRERERAALSVQLARAELLALRNQLHPHFLFNTLNTIAILVREKETVVAARLVTQLGDLLRHVLQGSRAHETTLDEELAVVRSYLEIEQVRFGDRLHVQWQIDERAHGATVPSLVLQPLIENALRHGVGQLTSRGDIEIGARQEGDELVLWIADNGPGVRAEPNHWSPHGETSSGVGLRNTRERLARLYPNRASLELHNQSGMGIRAEVRLPYRVWPTVVARPGGML